MPKGHPLYWPNTLVQAMHSDHLAGLGFDAIARKHGRYDRHGEPLGASVRNAFKCRGLRIIRRANTGRFPAAPLLTWSDIARIIEGEPKKLTGRWALPQPLRDQWRDWDLAKRTQVAALLKQHHGWIPRCPTGPCSAGVEPFAFGHPRAHAIAAALNAGLPSREHICYVRLQSEGVIFEGQLWFWKSGDCGYELGRHDPVHGRPALHRMIYERQHGPLTAAQIVVHLDGNKNNLDPANLGLRSRNDICRVNHAMGLTRQSRARMDALLQHQHQPTSHHDTLRSLA